jgi:hypothetical protein
MRSVHTTSQLQSHACSFGFVILSIDVCSTSLFSQTWLCQFCGCEICLPCYESINEVIGTSGNPRQQSSLPMQGHLKASMCSIFSGSLHAQSGFLPVSRFHQDELDQGIMAMEGLLQESNARSDTSIIIALSLKLTVCRPIISQQNIGARALCETQCVSATLVTRDPCHGDKCTNQTPGYSCFVFVGTN